LLDKRLTTRTMCEDFPKTRQEFEERFLTQKDFLSYLFTLRWLQGFICPSCRHQTSITAGTIFHPTCKALTLWLRAIWYITYNKTGSPLGNRR
jgi:hypothetical protein